MKIDAKVEGDDKVRQMLQLIGQQPAARALAGTAEEVEDYVHAEVGQHSKTGAMFRSVYKKRDGDGWEIGHDLQVAPQSLWVHWGTKPHVIRPKNKKVLRWPAGDKFAFAREVHHPGYKGDAWMVRAAAMGVAILARRVEAELDRIQKES